jgi:hypothetical protein
MAIIKSFSPKQNLSNFQVFINDDKPNSEYFKITEFNDTFTGGKNGFLIDGSECLKETSEVKIEILDVEGNPIYFEPGKGIPDYYEGTSKLVGVYVYEDTPIGTAKITILGELKSYFDDDGNKIDIPNEWKDVYNVKWERTLQINKNLSNENIVRFVKRPKVTITEIVKTIFNKSIPQVTQTGSLEGISLTPTAGTDLSLFSTPTNYKLKITDNGSWTSSIDENNITVRVPTETNLAASGSSNTGSLNYYVHEADGAPYVDVNLYVDGVQTRVTRGSGSLEWHNSPQTYNLQLHISNTPNSLHRYRMEIYDMSSNVMVYETSQGATTPSGFMSASSAGIIDSYEFTGQLGKVYGLMVQGIQDSNPSSAHDFRAYYEVDTLDGGGSPLKMRSTSYPLFEGNLVTVDGESSPVHTIQETREGSGTANGTISTAFPALKDYNNFFNPDVSTTEYVPKIIEVLNDKEVLVDIPFTGSNNLVSDFNSTSYTASFAHTEAQVITESALTGSFAKIDISNLKTFVGDVARVKVFRKSKNAIGDFQFVQESKLESIELLRDITTAADTELSYGEFDSYNLINYWTTGSNSPITLDNSVLKNSLHIDYTGSGVDTISTEQTLSITEGVEYAINFKTLLSGSFVTSLEDSFIRAYFSGSNYEQNLITTSGSAIYKTRQKVSQNILANQTVSDTHLKFDVKGDDWFISNVSLRNAQETSFSPDEFSLIQDIPRKTASETFDFRFEFYDVNNNFIPVNVVSTKEFDGGNDFPSSDKLLTFEADRNAFRFSSGSIGNPPFQQIQFKTTTSNLVGSLTFASSAFDASGVFIDPSSYTGEYPGKLTNPSNAGALIEIKNFSGSDDTITVGSIVYTASLDGVEEFETVFRLEDGDNAPQLIVTSNANQFIYEPTTLSPKPSGQSLTVKAQRKNLASLVTPVTVNSGSNKPALTFVDTVNGIDTYTISATQFSSSFASSDFDSVTYEFTGSDVFGNEQSDEITLSKVINFDAVSLVLSNESTSFPAKSTGEILGNLVPSSGSVQMFIGGTQIQHNDGLSVRNRFDITSITPSNVTATDSTPDTSNYSLSAFETTKDSGSLTLDIKYLAGDNITSQSFQKIVSYTKAKKAAPTVLTKTSPSTQTINSSSIGFDAPQTMEVIVQEGGDEYTFDAQSLSGGGDSLARKFNISSLFVDSGSISNSNNILTFGSLTASLNSVIGSASLDYVDSEGTYVTGKKVRFDLAVSKIGVDGVNGASGSNARAVSLSSTKYAVVYDGDGVLFPTSQPFTLTGSAQNFSNPQFQFLQNGSDISDGFGSVSELIIPTTTGSLPTAGGTNLYEVRVRETGGAWDDFNVLDNIDIFGVQSGSDAFTVFLTNEAHVFSATSQSVVTSDLEDGAFETRFFRGADQYNFGTTGKTYSISATSSSIELIQSTNSNQRLFTPSSITADSGSATIVVTDNNTGKTFDKKYSFTLSKEGLVGERGADGANGASGSNAKVVSLSSTKYAVVYDGDGVLFPTSQPFTLSGSAQNFTTPEFQFLEDGSQIQAFGVDTNVIIPTDAGSLPTAGASRLYEVRVRESGGSYEGVFDNIDVFGIQSGSDSFTTFLTNEAHVFSANSDGVVTSTLSDGSFETRFFRGADQYNFGTTGKTYSVSATSSSIELTQSTNSNQRKFTPTAASADNGTASITLTDNNTSQTFLKTYTFSKSKKGVPVTTIAASPQSQTITSGSGGIGTPANVTITVNEGGSDYGYDTAGAIPANNFRITGVTNATNNNNGTITPSTPTSSTPVTGVATISYTNSEGTAFTGKTIPFDVGVAGLGDTGAAGSAGSDSLSIKLTASQYAVLYNGAGTKTAVAIILTGTHQNFASPQYKFLENGVERQAFSTTSTYTIPDSEEAAANTTDLWRVEVREGGSGTYDAFDEVNIYGLKQGTDGDDGDDGDPGADGSDAYTVILTNESHTLPTTNTGTVTYTGSGTSIIVYKGSTELNSVTTTPSTNQFKVTVTSDTNITVGAQTVTGNPSVFAVASACTANTANIVFSVNIENTVTIPKIQSFSKSIEGAVGADGDPGDPGDNGRRTATGMVHYNAASSTAPTGPDDGSTTFTFNTGVMSGMRSGWQMGAPTYASGNSNKYWYATFSSLEETSLNGTALNGNNDFGSVTQAIGFSGLVSFTSGDAVTDGGGNNLSFGTAGATLIHGDNIATGKIISTNYATGSGDGFTTTGTELNLDDSHFAAPKFKITSAGDAIFRGTIDGGNLTIGTGSFTVSPEGAMTSTNATIEGSLTSEIGTIGGFSLSANALKNSDSTIQLTSTTGLPVIKLQNSSNQDKLVLSTAAALTPVGGTFTGLVIGVSATSITTFANSTTQTGTTMTQTNSSTTLSAGTPTRFPDTGTISAAADGLTLSGTITVDEHGSNSEIASTRISVGAGNSLNYGYLSFSYGVQIFKNGSTLIHTGQSPITTISQALGTYTGNIDIESPAGAVGFDYAFTVENGAYYEFKTFVNYISVFADFTIDPFNNRANTIRMTSRTPKITAGSATLSAAGAVSFAEINQGGIQIVTSATKLVRSDFNSSDAFSVTGSLSATGNITAFNSSDERLKNNIELIENPLDKVSQLNGVTFDWKDGFDDVHNYEGHDIGVIAQNVLHILPEITKLNEINGYYGVRYEKLTPLLIEAIKELSSKIEKLENKLKDKE